MPRKPASLPYRYATIGTEFAVTVTLLTLGGLWLDRRLGVTPALTIAGAVLGTAAGLYRLVRQARSAMGVQQRKDDTEP